MHTIRLTDAARWYGHVIALNGVTLDIQPGVVGLLGPNGAGKTTLLRMMVGLIRPTYGQVDVLGKNPFRDVMLRQKLGYCPEHDHFYEDLSGLKFVSLMTHLHGFEKREARDRAAAALERVCLPLGAGGENKPIHAYSKGMRQKTKLAQAIAHDPDIIILDEPLTGTDPMSRHQISDLCSELGREGRTLILSSHVLHEVERITKEFILLERGRLLAQGTVDAIRELIDQHPHQIQVHCSQARILAAHLTATPHISGITIESEEILTIQTPNPDACYDAIPKLALDANLQLTRLTSGDNTLAAVFRYLTRET